MEAENEYTVFTVLTADGTPAELAVVDEFEYDRKNYVAAARVEGDAIRTDEGLFIYRLKTDVEEFAVEKITDRTEYARISAAYLEMES